jgi:drug/metabolite transporter (DMT)-like permease
LFEYLKFSALPVVGPFVTTSVLLLQLPFAMILGYIALRERLTWQMTTAAACILTGAFLAGLPA